MTLDFTALDFETANSYRGSPCSVGLVKVRAGRVVDQRHWLIRPPEGADHFSGFNVSIHGITNDMVADAPRWKDILPAIVEFIGDDVVIAHNAGFDIGVIRYACAVDNIEWPAMHFLCTLVLSRRALRLPVYRLPYVAETLGVPFENHHDALADAHAVVGIIRALAELHEVDDLDDLAASIGVYIGHISKGIYKGTVAVSGTGVLVRSEANTDADPAGYLYGRVIVFTGTLMAMTRQIAWDECARIGSIAEPNVTKRTNVLVVGDINPAVLRPGSNVTGKARKAFELQDKGQEIEVMTEDDFLRCVAGKPLEGVDEALTEVVNVERSPFRSTPLADRPQPRPDRPPRPLRRAPVPTDQGCSIDGCGQTAAFKTRINPTWCAAHIEEILRAGGLRSVETFTHPLDWQLTECLACTVQAHYRFVYVQEKNSDGQRVCRACFWREWAANSRQLQREWADTDAVMFEDAKAFSEANGYEYLGPLTAPSLSDDPHHVKCRRCGKVSAERLGDIGFGCTCRT